MAKIFKAKTKKRVSSDPSPKQLQIDSLSHDGRGIARHQGKAVFVDGGLVGEQVEVAHYRRQKNFSECQAKQILQSSPERVDPVCPVFDQCGGCQLQHLRADKQIQYKQSALLSLLQRQYQLQPEMVLEPILSASVGYRSRVRFGIDSQRKLSFRQKLSDKLVAVGGCPVLEPSLQGLISGVQAWLDGLEARPGVTHIEMIAAADELGQESTALLVRHIKPLPRPQREALLHSLGSTQCWFQADKSGQLTGVDGNPVDPRLLVILNCQSIELAFSPRDFTQVNRAVNQQMVTQAMEWLQLQPSDKVADLYCGMGNFSLAIARQCQQLLGVEGVDAMVARAQENADRNSISGTEFKAMDLTSTDLSGMLRRRNITKLVLDPPRAGAKAVCEQMAQTAVENLVYVSCNPASFARDASILVEGGYRMTSLRVMDMFPHTSHMETMALFVRG